MKKATQLLDNFKSKKAVIGVIGLGYVGLPLAILFAEHGYQVIGFDTSESHVNKLNEGHSLISDISSERLQKITKTKKFIATIDAQKLEQVDAIIICVPTPLTSSQEPDISYIQDAVSTICRYASSQTVIILESTTYPGTSRDLLLGPLEAEGFQLDKDVYVCYSPERVDPGNIRYQTDNTPKVIGGVSEVSLQVGIALYQEVIQKVVPVSSTEVAEMSKLLENTFRSINIAFINEMAMLCDALNIDIWETIEASSTKPFGFMRFTPGPGIGGHCIPLDPMYLSWKAKEANFFSRFIELAQDINHHMPNYVVQQASKCLNTRKKSLNGATILLIGMSYKPNSHDIRESPGVVVFDLLKIQGAIVRFWDPLAPVFKGKNGTVYTTEEVDYSQLTDYDLVIILSCHDIFNKIKIKKCSPLLLDTQQALRYTDIHSDKI
ncbi:nucleotide sugar dehydrogenase [Carnobacterium maltaromaticum]|uniref:nucleotide sugar dehydrogenase n=1 Tax=Carnobacterium maltaromaticum TaxID=2751 RepID=UPI00191BB4CB|nr:nucleotide sugar dehydrogenase [Carnobacterium maltaromaticum]CAD5902916.1 UDP-N-acetyl-D-glucosamine 6-dehydrogenase [Carnobacterium maltaromaticum]